MNLTVPVNLELTPASQALLERLCLIGRVFDAPTAAPAASFAYANTPPAHGEYWVGQGGYYICTLPALLGLPARHLIASKDEGEELTFGPYEDISGATSPIDGPSNTKALLAAGKHPAAKWASEHTTDGHSDFHLPAKLDMVMAQICAPQLFNKEGYYWTSTQDSRGGAFVQDCEYGSSGWDGKDTEHRVRAFRWIHLNA